MASVSGFVYEAEAESGAPTVRLFTKEGCTLCDKVKDVLKEARATQPHTLEQVDITDAGYEETWWDKYKYDIPVLHLDGQYWTKHKLSIQEAQLALQEIRDGTFESPRGEPNAGELERRQAARSKEEAQ